MSKRLVTFIFFLLFAVFIFFQSPYLAGGDSAEFPLVAKTFSINHAPGYPFYTILSIIISRIVPFFTLSWRVALLSSIPTVLTAIFIYKILIYYKLNRPIAVFSSIFYCFLFPIWLYGEIPEVFALNNLIIVLITYLIILYTNPLIHKSTNKLIYSLSFLFGLAFSHHQIFILFIPGWFLLIKKRLYVIKKSNFLKLIFFFLAGLSFYLYPIIAGRFNPPLNWENSGSLTGFIALITRSSYGTFRAAGNSAPQPIAQLIDAFSLFVFLIQDFKPLGIFIIILGLLKLIKTNKAFFQFIVVTLVIQLFFLYYTNFVIVSTFNLAIYERYLIVVYLVLIFPFAYGVQTIFDYFTGFIGKHLSHPFLRDTSRLFLPVFFLLFLLIMILNNLKAIMIQKDQPYFDNYAKNILDTLPKGAIITVDNDTSFFTSAYYYYSEKYRKDVQYVFFGYLSRPFSRQPLKRQYPNLVIANTNDGAKKIKDFLNKNNRFGIYSETPITFGVWEPIGLLWKYYPDQKQAEQDKNNLLALNKEIWEKRYQIPILDKQGEKILHLQFIRDQYLNGLKQYSMLLFENNKENEAILALKRIIDSNSSQSFAAKLIVSNIYINRNRCLLAKKIIEPIEDSKLTANPNYLESALSYFEKCDRTNKEYTKLKTLQKNSTKQSCSLNNI